mgnify:CR=1 FL=1
MRWSRAVQSAAGALCALMALASAATAQADDPWNSIYDGTPFAGYGWSNCPQPIVVSADLRGVRASARPKVRRAMTAAIREWNRGRVVGFVDGGEEPMAFDRASKSVTPAAGDVHPRHIYLLIARRMGAFDAL